MGERPGTRQLHVIGLITLLLAGPVVADPKLSISPLGYRVTQLQPVPGMARTYDLTARVGVVNRGGPALAVTAQLTSTSPSFLVLDGDVSFGDVPRTPVGRPVISHDTFTLRIVLPPRRELRDFIRSIDSSLAWSLSCSNCGAGNRPPVAAAGADQTAHVGQLVTLDGSGSSDPDAQPLTYAWSFVTRPAGSTAALSGANTVRATFTPDREGDYVARLVVSDGVTDSAPDTVQVSTLNSPPVANAGPDQAAAPGQEMLLDGSASSDVDGDPLTYRWSVAAGPEGSAARILDPTHVQARFTPDLPGDYLLELVVNDGTVSSTPDNLVISTKGGNVQPVADAGPDQSVRVGDTVALDGSASRDADGDVLSFRWSLNARPADSTAELQAGGTSTPFLTIDRPGTYVVQLIVSDGQVDSAPDTISISTTNSAPLARIAAPESVTWRTTVALDGLGSSDPDGDALTFTWSILTRPQDSQAVLSTTSGTGPAFVPDRPGVYVVQLVVNDGHVDSSPVTATITATNQAPVAADDVVSTAAGTPIPVAVLLNDSDADGDALAVVSVSSPEHGAATLQGGVIRYEPAMGFTGTDSVRYVITDGAETASASVWVTVTSTLNRNPVAADDSATTPTGTPITIDVLANDSDPDGDALTIASVTQPANGTAAIAGTAVTFTPATGFSGSTLFNYTVSDGHGGTATALVTLAVTGTPGEFTFTLAYAEMSGFAGSRVLVPFRLARDAGTTEAITVMLAGAPDGITAAGAIVPDGIADGILAIAIASDVAPGSVALQLVAASGNVSRSASLTLQVAAARPSSLELIRAAMLAGELDRPTSLLYRAYALVGDARLPSAYRGSGSIEEDTGLFAEINELLPTLPSELSAQLQPFVLRPSNPNSWYSQLLASLPSAAAPASNGFSTKARTLSGLATLAEGDPVLPSTCDDDPAAPLKWISVRSDVHGFRAWAHCVAGEPRAAEKVVAETVAVFDVLWGPMTGDMGPARPDVAPGTPISPADGVGDETIDIYLMFPGDVVTRLGETYGGVAHANGWAQTWNASGNSSSGFISIPVTTVIEPSFHITAAHELFHVLQFGHNYQLSVGAVPTGFGGFPNAPRLSWWYVEASAEWAGAHYDRALAGALQRGRHAPEAVYGPWFTNGFQTRDSSMSLNSGGEVDAPGAHLPYEAFIWPYFLEQESGDASRPAGQIWAAVAGAATPNDADRRMDALVSFESNLRKFTVRNLNTEAVGNRYEALDPGQFPKDAPPHLYHSHFRAGPAQKVDFALTTLAAQYIRLDNDAEDNLQKVSVDFTGLDAARAELGIDVDVLLKLKGGGWQAARDFNATKKKTWCLDEDDVESMYLVISAHKLEEAGVITRNVSIEYTASVAPCRPTWEGTSRLSSTQGADVVSTASAEGVTFELLGEEDETSNLQAFGVVAGGVAKMIEMIIDCERSPQPASVPIKAGEGSMLIAYSSDGKQMTVTGSATTFYTGSVIVLCSTGERFDQASIAASWMSFGNGITVPVAPPGEQQKIQGTFNVSVAPGTNSILTIDLKLVRQ